MARSALSSARTRAPSNGSLLSIIEIASPFVPSGRDRFAKDVLGRELAIPERIALDTALFAHFAGRPHRLADAERHEGQLTGVVIGHLMEALRREQRLLLGQMRGDGGG